jgi:hypothetical protein
MIRMIVGRCHVGDTNRQVVRYLISRLKKGYASWQAMPREQRRLAMRECIRIHAENRGVYRFVMSGQTERTAILSNKETP